MISRIIFRYKAPFFDTPCAFKVHSSSALLLSIINGQVKVEIFEYGFHWRNGRKIDVFMKGDISLSWDRSVAGGEGGLSSCASMEIFCIILM